MYMRVTEVQKDYMNGLERNDALEKTLQQFGRTLEVATLEARQAKNSGETAKTVDSLANAAALSQDHTDKGLEWTRDGLGQGLDVLTKEVANLATRVNREHQEPRRRGRGKTRRPSQKRGGGTVRSRS